MAGWLAGSLSLWQETSPSSRAVMAWKMLGRKGKEKRDWTFLSSHWLSRHSPVLASCVSTQETFPWPVPRPSPLCLECKPNVLGSICWNDVAGRHMCAKCLQLGWSWLGSDYLLVGMGREGWEASSVLILQWDVKVLQLALNWVALSQLWKIFSLAGEHMLHPHICMSTLWQIAEACGSGPSDSSVYWILPVAHLSACLLHEDCLDHSSLHWFIHDLSSCYNYHLRHSQARYPAKWKRLKL